MRKNIFFIIFSFIFCLGSQTTFESVQKGKGLEKISEISLDEFFRLWIRNRRKLKFQTNVSSLFEDEDYTYFGKTDIYEYTWKNRFFKIKKDLLQTEFPNYPTFFAEDLERYYFEHLQSKEDSIYLDRLENEDWKECGPDYSYSLIRRKVILQVFWKVNSTCPKLSNFQGKNIKFNLIWKQGRWKIETTFFVSCSLEDSINSILLILKFSGMSVCSGFTKNGFDVVLFPSSYCKKYPFWRRVLCGRSYD